ncbi:hypothetical protein ABKN59_007714 [Abortiporus biennis]
MQVGTGNLLLEHSMSVLGLGKNLRIATQQMKAYSETPECVAGKLKHTSIRHNILHAIIPASSGTQSSVILSVFQLSTARYHALDDISENSQWTPMATPNRRASVVTVGVAKYPETYIFRNVEDLFRNSVYGYASGGRLAPVAPTNLTSLLPL